MLTPQRLQRVYARLYRLGQPIGQIERGSAFVVQVMARQFGLHRPPLYIVGFHGIQPPSASGHKLGLHEYPDMAPADIFYVLPDNAGGS